MANAAALGFLSAVDLLEAYRRAALSPVEVVRDCLERIGRDASALNAFLVVDSERALAEAQRSEARWRRNEPLGLLDGVPVSVKDLCLARGLPSRNGSLTTAATPATEDAPAVARLNEQGAILLGKTTMCEFGWKGVTDSPLTGISRNPWSPDRTCGGSSGGAAIAAALGMGALHLGSDGAGSIRIPAAFCGVYGFKATFGRVPTYPPGRVAVGHYGPLTRTVQDAALMLNVISQPDSRDWTALPYDHRDFRAGLDEGIAGWRIAYCPDLCGARPDPEVARIAADAVRVFEALGANVEEVSSPIASPRAPFELLWAASMAQIYRKISEERRSLLDPGFAAIAQTGLEVSGNQLLDAIAARHVDGAAMNAFHDTYDLLITPQMPTTAFAAGVDYPTGRGMTSWLDWSPYTYPFNWTQQTAASLPCGLSSDGLPVALQLVAARFAEDKVLRASRAFERVRPFPSLRDRAA
jgi:aspartyl-tRNA(Asn)/glutamyl-tRNA(Gln) amidotransferase subunit A